MASDRERPTGAALAARSGFHRSNPRQILAFTERKSLMEPTMRTLTLITVMSLLASPSFAQQQQQGTASYYQGGQSGHTQTKSGTPVNPNSNEAASPNLPLGSEATVTNKNTGKSTDVKVTDRGPTRHDRVIDLSKKSANDVGMQKQGTAPVTVQPK